MPAEQPDPDRLADVVVHLVRLAGEGAAVSYRALEPVALLLAQEGRLAADLLSFGSDYDLSVASHEIRRGFSRAYDGGRLKADSQTVWLGAGESRLLLEPCYADDARRAQELFALDLESLLTLARPILLEWRERRERWARGDFQIVPPGPRQRLSAEAEQGGLRGL